LQSAILNRFARSGHHPLTQIQPKSPKQEEKQFQ
jgi:hypothetical protein